MPSLLTQVGFGLFGVVGVAHQRDRLACRVNDQLFESRREERDYVALHGERRSFRLPVERDILVGEVEANPHHLQICHGGTPPLA
jgi:hypothetical protein